MPTLEPMSPDWWVRRLHKQLIKQQDESEMFDAYYCGDHPLPWLAPQAQHDFRRILKMTRSNYMGLVVDATAERLSVEGFRIGNSEEADKDTWRIWQANNLDAHFDQGIVESLIVGRSYLLVAPNPKDASTPNAWVEHPSQAIVEYVPGTNRRVRAAGLKLWLDDWSDLLMATLYLPDGLYKFQAPHKRGASVESVTWQRRQVRGEQWPAKNPLGVVPLIELPNNPRLLRGGVSELADVVDIQDRINKTLADRLITQDYGAFPQKWAAGWPEQDEDGNPQPKIDVGRDRMVTTDLPRNVVEFGQWDAAPLDPYSAAKREDVKDIASRTRTPAQYLLGEMSNVNGETLKASESGLVSKVKQRARTLSDPTEDAARLMRRAAGLPDSGDAGMEVIWRDPEYRTEGERVDALVKMSTLGVPHRALWERWGASQTEMDRWEEQLAQQNADPVLERVARSLTAGGPGAPAVNG